MKVHSEAKKVILGVFMLLLALSFTQANTIHTNDRGMQYVPGELIIKFRSNQVNLQKPRGVQTLSQFEEENNFAVTAALPKENIALVTLPNWSDVQEKIDELSSDPNIEYIQPNYLYELLSPNDPLFYIQRSLDNIGQNVGGIIGTTGDDIQRLDAMNIWSGDGNPLTTGTTVAVLDVGISYTHQDLANQMWDGTNCISSTGVFRWWCSGGGYNAYAAEKTGGMGAHGTHVAGIIWAQANNAMGVAGVNPWAKIMNITIGNGNSISSYHAIAALSFAKYNWAKVVNMSRWSPSYIEDGNPDPWLYNAIKYFPWLVTIAAGNWTTEHIGNYFVTPADFAISSNYWSWLDNIISVAGTDQDDHIVLWWPWAWSDYGSNISIWAPACVYSTVPGNQIAYSCGTSMAAPHVAWVASLLRSFRPSLSYLDIKNILLDKAETIPALQGKTRNAKRLNAFKPLEYLYVKQISGLTLYDNSNKENIITSGSYLSGMTWYIERWLSPISGQVSTYIVILNYSWTTIEATWTTQTWITMSLSGDWAYEVTITPIADDKDLTGDTQTLSFLVDSTIPTASVVYSPASWTITSGNVLATLTWWNEDLYNINTTWHIFTWNGSFTFVFSDISWHTGSVVATVDWINKPSNFSFSAQTNVELATSYVSNAVTITWIITWTEISIVWWLYSVNSGEFTWNLWIIYSWDNIKTKLTSSSSYGTQITSTLNIGGYTWTFSVTTKSAPSWWWGWGGGGWGGGWWRSKPTCTSTDLMCSLSIYVTKPGISCLWGNLWMTCVATGTVVQTWNNSGNIFYQTLSTTLSPLFSPELNQAYIYAREIGITTVPSIERANLTGTLIRQHLAKMISNFSINVLEKTPNTWMNCTFKDMHNATSEMKFYAKLACQLWLMGLANDGTPNDNFYPEVEVTRAQFGTVLSRALRGNKYNDSDAENYFTEHLEALKDAWIMKKINDPFNLELRGYVMLMMMRSVE